MSQRLSEPAKLLLVASLLSKDRLISNNGKAFLKGALSPKRRGGVLVQQKQRGQLMRSCMNLRLCVCSLLVHCALVLACFRRRAELVLRRDPRLTTLLEQFESKSESDATFLENIHALIGAWGFFASAIERSSSGC